MIEPIIDFLFGWIPRWAQPGFALGGIAGLLVFVLASSDPASQKKLARRLRHRRGVRGFWAWHARRVGGLLDWLDDWLGRPLGWVALDRCAQVAFVYPIVVLTIGYGLGGSGEIAGLSFFPEWTEGWEPISDSDRKIIAISGIILLIVNLITFIVINKNREVIRIFYQKNFHALAFFILHYFVLLAVVNIIYGEITILDISITFIITIIIKRIDDREGLIITSAILIMIAILLITYISNIYMINIDILPLFDRSLGLTILIHIVLFTLMNFLNQFIEKSEVSFINTAFFLMFIAGVGAVFNYFFGDFSFQTSMGWMVVLALLPAINAAHDFASLAVSRILLRRAIAEKGSAITRLVEIVADLAVALICLLSIAFFLPLGIEAANALYDVLEDDFRRFEWEPYIDRAFDGFWTGIAVWSMLLTTLVPTLVHLLLGSIAIFAQIFGRFRFATAILWRAEDSAPVDRFLAAAQVGASVGFGVLLLTGLYHGGTHVLREGLHVHVGDWMLFMVNAGAQAGQGPLGWTLLGLLFTLPPLLAWATTPRA